MTLLQVPVIDPHNPNDDAEIRCIPSCADPAHPARYPVTTSGEHLRRQFTRTQAY